MTNELILIITLVFLYASVLMFYKFFGIKGLMAWTVFATISANIEVMIMVDAFGMSQTLGNIMFATTFIVTDILSEVAGKKEAHKAVNLGILTSITFIITSQLWLLFTPNLEDWAFPSIQTLFSNTPRLMFAGLVVYAIAQKFDVWAYGKWWVYTKKLSLGEGKL